MSLVLVHAGPFDPAMPEASTRAALARHRASLEQGALLHAHRVADPAPDSSSIHLLVDDDSSQLHGLWFTFGADYLRHGPLGPPDREPPYVAAALRALTEAAWWSRLATNAALPTWRPVVVLEWPPALASRSACCPPGQPSSTLEEAWPAEADDKTPPGLDALWAQCPRDRSVVCVVQATLTLQGSRHTASYRLVPTSVLTTDGPPPLPVWVDRAATARPGEGGKGAGSPLQIDVDRVALPIDGWLTRDLALWPGSAEQVRAGALPERDVTRRRLVLQRLAAVVLLALVFIAASLGMAVVGAKMLQARPTAPVASPSASPLPMLHPGASSPPDASP